MASKISEMFKPVKAIVKVIAKVIILKSHNLKNLLLAVLKTNGHALLISTISNITHKAIYTTPSTKKNRRQTLSQIAYFGFS